MESQILTSTKPYLIRALFEWIVDNGCTPYVIVNADAEHVEVPRQYVEDSRIIFNISNEAVRDLLITNEHLEFNARFNGVSTEVYAPIAAILAIYAQENGHGMIFNEEGQEVDPTPPNPKVKKPIKRPNPAVKPNLRVVRNDSAN
jgi:stringent starvation protein B